MDTATAALPAPPIINQFVGVAHGDFDQMRALLEQYPALLNTPARWGETAIQAATQVGRVDMVEYLLDKGAPCDICTAAMLGRTEQVEAMLKDDPGLIKATGAHGIPLLYFPVIKGNRELAESLLARGAELNAGEGSNTPLHGAVLWGTPDMVTWLLAKGARTDIGDNDGKTALEVAEANGKTEAAELLRKA
jgi:ankyrin repeat protein